MYTSYFSHILHLDIIKSDQIESENEQNPYIWFSVEIDHSNPYIHSTTVLCDTPHPVVQPWPLDRLVDASRDYCHPSHHGLLEGNIIPSSPLCTSYIPIFSHVVYCTCNYTLSLRGSGYTSFVNPFHMHAELCGSYLC